MPEEILEHPVLNGVFVKLGPVEILTLDVAHLLTGAIEGGSNYWMTDVHYELADGLNYQQFRENQEFNGTRLTYFHPFEIIPFKEGCKLTFKDAEEDTELSLDREAMKKGLELMMSKYPQHWADFIKDEYDAATSDVFLQLCVLGDIVYG